jgi:hypothetical protein
MWCQTKTATTMLPFAQPLSLTHRGPRLATFVVRATSDRSNIFVDDGV